MYIMMYMKIMMYICALVGLVGAHVEENELRLAMRDGSIHIQTVCVMSAIE